MRKIMIPGVILAAVLLAPGVAAAGEDSGITVTGEGRVLAKPDIARINTGVEVRRPSAKEAYAGAMAAMGALTEKLGAAGVADRDIQTTEISLHPEHDRDDGSKITGYQGSASVRATVRKIDSAGKVLDAVGSGGDETRISGISFDIDDKTAVLEQARKEAVRDARTKAAEYAAHAGAKLGDVISITEQTSPSPIPLEFDVMPMAGAAAPESKIHPGENEVTVKVRMVYELRGTDEAEPGIEDQAESGADAVSEAYAAGRAGRQGRASIRSRAIRDQ